MVRRRRRSLASIFSVAHCQGRKVMTVSELARAGLTRRKIDSAVQAGKLRCGLSGCWLPERPDPGALSVMCKAMRNQLEGARSRTLRSARR